MTKMQFRQFLASFPVISQDTHMLQQKYLQILHQLIKSFEMTPILSGFVAKKISTLEGASNFVNPLGGPFKHIFWGENQATLL